MALLVKNILIDWNDSHQDIYEKLFYFHGLLIRIKEGSSAQHSINDLEIAYSTILSSSFKLIQTILSFEDYMQSGILIQKSGKELQTELENRALSLCPRIYSMLLNEYLVNKKILDGLQYGMSPEILNTYLHIWETQAYIDKKVIQEFIYYIELYQFVGIRMLSKTSP